MLWVLQETIWMKRSRPGTSTSSLIAARVGHAEAELAALGEEALGARELVVVLLLHLVAGRGAVDHHRGARERLLGLVGDLVAELLEGVLLVGVGRELRAARHQVVDLGAVGGERRPLVEGDLVDPHLLPEVGEQADQRLADRARADDVDDRLLHDSPPQLPEDGSEILRETA